MVGNPMTEQLKFANENMGPYAQSNILLQKQRPNGEKDANLRGEKSSQRIAQVIGPVFQAIPSEVYFSSFKLFSSYESRVRLQNTDSIAHRLKLRPLDSRVFHLTLSPGQKNHSGTSKVAPGMEVELIICFTPEDYRDYSVEVEIESDRDLFVIPIRARRSVAIPVVPKHLQFDNVPCRTSSTQPILIRNTRDRSSSFLLRESPAKFISVYPKQGVLAPGQSLRIDTTFNPVEAGEYSGEIRYWFQHENEELGTSITTVSGIAIEVDVRLSTSLIRFPETYLSKTNQVSIRLINDSRYLVKYRWQSDRNVRKSKPHDQYSGHFPTITKEHIWDPAGDMEAEKDDSNYLSIIGNEDGLIDSEIVGAGNMMTCTEIKGIKTHTVAPFSITPAYGEIWPNSESEIIVNFRPEDALKYMRRAQILVSGISELITLSLNGQGIGPNVTLSTEILNIGELLCKAKYSYEFDLENRGEIDASFRLVNPTTDVGKQFQFSPVSGIVPVGQKVKINIYLKCQILGEIQEHFFFYLKGSADMISLEIRGRIAGPKFDIDKKELDFGLRSIGFECSDQILIVNNSMMSVPIELDFQHQSESDGALFQVKVSPEAGVINSQERKHISVSITPLSLSNLQSYIAVRVPGIGEDLARIPVTLEPRIPKIAIDHPNYDFGPCFLRYSYKKSLTLRNTSDFLPARFMIADQDVSAHIGAVCCCTPSSGIIQPNGEVQVAVEFRAESLGPIHIPIHVHTTDSFGFPLTESRLEANLVAHSVGPTVSLQPTSSDAVDIHNTEANSNDSQISFENCVGVKEFDFGKINVLMEASRTCTLKNTSMINMEYSASLESNDSPFFLENNRGKLEPGESVNLIIKVLMDDTIKFRDKLRIKIYEGEEIEVILCAQGFGTMIVCEELREKNGSLDFGERFVGCKFCYEIKLENKGRRPQVIVWANEALLPPTKMINDSLMLQKKGPKDNEIPIAFTVTPFRSTIKPRQKATYLIEGLSREISVSQEYLICKSLGGPKKQTTILRCCCSASFVVPLVECAVQNLSFRYDYEEAKDISVILQEDLIFKNVSRLPLAVHLRCTPPFQIDRLDWTLQDGETASARVSFNPSYRGDKQSSVYHGRIVMQFQDADKNMTIPLVGEVNYPNLTLEVDRVDFGCVLNKTISRRNISVTNISKISAEFHWTFEEVEPAVENPMSETEISIWKKSKAQAVQSFDILPIQTTLSPGESQTFVVSYVSGEDSRHEATAVCRVKGGPEYQLPLTAESSTIRYTIDQTKFDFGVQLLNKPLHAEMTIANTGRVSFHWALKLSTLVMHRGIEINSTRGFLRCGERYKVIFKVLIGLPDQFSETLFVEIEHLQPIKVQITAEGTYQYAVLNLPRAQDPRHEKYLEQARVSLEETGPWLQLHECNSCFPRSSTKTAQSSQDRSSRGSVASLQSDLGTTKDIHPVSSSSANADDQEKESDLAEKKTWLQSERIARVEADRIGMKEWLIGLEESHGQSMSNSRRGMRNSALDVSEGGLNSTGKNSVNNSRDTYSHLCGSQSGKNIESSFNSGLLFDRQRIFGNLNLILSTYFCDFGPVTMGTLRRRSLRLINCGMLNLSIDINQKAARLQGFSVSPESMQVSPSQSAEFVVSFQSTPTSLSGKVESSMQVEFKKGPSLEILLVANLVIPELKIEHETIPFGRVKAGNCKVAKVSLSNRCPVTCEWRINRPTTGPSCRDWNFFTIEPSAGHLEPGESAPLKICFVPDTSRAKYKIKIPIKAKHSSQPQFITCTGECIEPRVVLEPTILDFGAVLPETEEFSDSQSKYVQGRSMNFELVNQSSVPVEVFSTDFDNQYVEEERMLSSYSEFSSSSNNSNVCWLSPRQPGETLWEDVRMQWKETLTEEERLKFESEESLCQMNINPVVEEGTQIESSNDISNDGFHILLIDSRGPEGLYQPGDLEILASQLADHYGVPVETNSMSDQKTEDSYNSRSEVNEHGDNSSSNEKSNSSFAESASEVESPRGSQSCLEYEDPLADGFKTSIFHGTVDVENIETFLTRFGIEPDNSQGSESSSNEYSADSFGLSQEYERNAEASMSVIQNILSKKWKSNRKVYLFEVLDEVDLDNISINEVREVTGDGAFVVQGISALSLNSGIEELKQALPRAEEVFPRNNLEPTPEIKEYQIVQKPKKRPVRNIGEHFSLCDPLRDEDSFNLGISKSSERLDNKNVMRWVLQPQERVRLRVNFSSSEIGEFSTSIEFEICGRETWGLQNPLTVQLMGSCTYPQICRDPNFIFSKTVKTKPSLILTQKFIRSERTLDFGPLFTNTQELLDESQDPENEESSTRLSDEIIASLKKNHCSVLRIANVGKFDCTVTSNVIAEGDDDEIEVFETSPKSLDLKIGQSKEISVFAYPTTPGQFKASLALAVEENPEELKYSISAEGALPAIEVSADEINFQRVIAGKASTESFEIKNICPHAVNWWLDDFDKNLTEFKISLLSGTLRPWESVQVEVLFTANTPGEYQCSPSIYFTDVRNIQNAIQLQTLLINAESYLIEVDCVYPEKESLLDFETVRVADTVSKQVSLLNKGKFAVHYRISYKSQIAKELFSVSPLEGEISPSSRTEVDVIFNKDASLLREVEFEACSDIQIIISEPLTGEREVSIPLSARVRAVFSKFTILPAKGINFGPHLYNTVSATKEIEIINNGKFPFQYIVEKFESKSTSHSHRAPQSDGHEIRGRKHSAATDKEKHPPASSKGDQTLTIGSFSLTGVNGTVESGASAKIFVTFGAQDVGSYSELLAIKITDRDLNNSPEGIKYGIAGESCIPGIEAKDVESIFEEHLILPMLTTADAKASAIAYYAEKENIFHFGNLIANLNPKSSQDDNEREFDGKEESLDMGTVANFKIINPEKIPCSVTCHIVPSGEHSSHDTSNDFPMTVQPSQIEIPPHENRYVSCYFRPNAIKSYSAKMEVNVEKGFNPATKQLSFGLRGQGTIPHVIIEESEDLILGERYTLRFPRTLASRFSSKTVVISNQGVLQAEISILHSGSTRSGAFQIVNGDNKIFLQPKAKMDLEISFTPKTPDLFQETVEIHVQDNRFGTIPLDIVGEGYFEDVLMIDSEGEPVDCVSFKDGSPIQETCKVRSLKNFSKESVAFEFQSSNLPKGISVSPITGRLSSGEQKELSIFFNPLEECKYEREPMPITIMSYLEENEEDLGDAFSAPPATSGSRPRAKPCIEKGQADNSYTKDFIMYVSAIAGYAEYECEARDITFKKTTMFQVRTFAFQVRNTGTVDLILNWALFSATGDTKSEETIYTISPTKATLASGESQSFQIRFAPTEVEDCSRIWKARIPNRGEGTPDLVLKVNGAVSRPWCHFELPASCSLKRRWPFVDLQYPMKAMLLHDENIRAIEFSSLGIKIRNTKRFKVLNPTSVPLEYVWKREGEQTSIDTMESTLGWTRESHPPTTSSPKLPFFHCLSERGLIRPGLDVEMVFEFMPQEKASVESFWTLSLPNVPLVQPFVLVGQVIEPDVSLDTVGLNFGKVMCGTSNKKTIYLQNNEHIPFSFAVARKALDHGDDLELSKPRVTLQPKNGIVEPQSTLPVEVTFSPSQEGPANVSFFWTIKKKSSKLKLNVKGEGYSVHDLLQLVMPGELGSPSGDSKLVTLSSTSDTFLDFGQVLINDRAINQFILSNGGDCPFAFRFETGESPHILANPPQGSLEPGESLKCEICFCPATAETLNNYCVRCIIGNVKKYRMMINAQGHRPHLQFSRDSLDFGSCFVIPEDAIADAGKDITEIHDNIIKFTATNRDTRDISFTLRTNDQSRTSQSGTSPWAVSDMDYTVLSPGESKALTAYFSPRSPDIYIGDIECEIRGIYVIHLPLRGKGVEPNIRVAGNETVLNFGAIRIGQELRRSFKVFNGAEISAKLTLDQETRRAMDNYCIEALGSKELYIRPRATTSIDLAFKPSKRLSSFQFSFIVESSGGKNKLLEISGACLGVEIKLINDNIQFGVVAFQSKSIKRVFLQNSGDIAVQFSWDRALFGRHFCISPSEGYVSPGQIESLDAVFEPRQVDPDLRAEKIRCRVSGCEDLFLTLMGSCIEQSPEETVLSFQAAVRCSATQEIKVTNPTSQMWQIQPIISSQCWLGAKFFNISPNSSAGYALSYVPMRMTESSHLPINEKRTGGDKNKPDEGTVLFPCPDGSALLYTLRGVATPPQPVKEYSLSIPAKSSRIEELEVSNWLNVSQRLSVHIMKDSEDPTLQLQGSSHIDVPSLSSKQYSLKIYGYQQGANGVSVYFKNPDSNEYLWYKIKLEVSSPQTLSEHTLSCTVRQEAETKVAISNPLDSDVSISLNCSDPQVHLKQETKLKAGCTTQVTITYFPLVVFQGKVDCVIQSEELGNFHYALDLKATPAPPEPPLQFLAPLGGQDMQIFHFTHHLREKAEYQCSLESDSNNCFEVEASVIVSPSTQHESKVQVQVIFEPRTLGDTFEDRLIISSPKAGEYICPLIGRSIFPPPQGPYIVKKGSPTNLSFKNVFCKTVEFRYAVDNIAFSVPERDTLPAKKMTNIQVSASGKDTGKTTGKLTIQCSELPTSWVYYLQLQPQKK